MSEKPESVGREVLYDIVENHIAVVQLNRPDRRNAVNNEVAVALDWIVKETEANDAVRVVILGSTSDGAFCAGADLSEISRGRAHLLSTRDGGFAGLATARREKPWIAAVAAPALAGGCELALSCHMIVASDNASFGLPEVKRGLFAGAGGVFRLTRRLPVAIAMELIATGDPLPARRAYELGFVNRLTSRENVMEEALTLARAIGVNAPLSVRESLKVAGMSFDRPESELWSVSKEASGREV